jgi:hypothetical protein
MAQPLVVQSKVSSVDEAPPANAVAPPAFRGLLIGLVLGLVFWAAIILGVLFVV